MKHPLKLSARGMLALAVSASMCASSIPLAAFAATSMDADDSEPAYAVASDAAESAVADADGIDAVKVVSENRDASEGNAASADMSQGLSGEASIPANLADEADDPTEALDQAFVQMESTGPKMDFYPYGPTGMDIRAYGGGFATAKDVRFAVWSDEGGQDDIAWYKGTKLGDNLWGLTIPLPNHRSYGTYSVHAYDARPSLTGIATGSFSIAAPTATLSITQSDAQRADGTFTATISDVSDPSAVEAFLVPTWSQAGGQDDIVWHKASKKGSDVWEVEILCAGGKRKPGEYNVHLYVKGKNGLLGFVAGTKANVEAPDSVVSATLADDEKTAVVMLQGPAARCAQRVTFPTWSVAGNQDDLIWYEGTKNPDGSWQATIDISKHATIGEYTVHAYAKNESGNGFVGAAGFEVGPIGAKVEVSDVDNGRYTLTVTVDNSPSGAIMVHVPTWTQAGGQDDIIWYGADRISDNVWKQTVSAGNHNGEEGTYNSHIYVTAGNGIRVGVATRVVNLKCRNFAFATGAMGSGVRNICIKHPKTDDVQVAVWSDEGGQDDLNWIRSTHVGSSVYAAGLDCHAMKHAGSMTAHIYVSGKHEATVTFTIDDNDLTPPAYRQMRDRIQGVNSSTGYLIAVDTSRCIVGIFGGRQGNWSLVRSHACAPGAPWSPTVKGYFSVSGKGYVFGSGYSCYYWTQFYGNYLFHSILYNPGTFTVQDPTMGRPVSHGCVRLYIENAKWIYDNIPYGTRVVVY